MLFWLIGLQAFLRCVTVSGRDLFVPFRVLIAIQVKKMLSYKIVYDSGVYRKNGWSIFCINELNYYFGAFF